jgi:thiamine-phosphate pyrophosphorylase
MLVVLTHPASVPNEFSIIHELFDEGLELLHIYKPDESLDRKLEYFQKLSDLYPGKVALHEQALKFHSVQEWLMCRKTFDYAFLSPVFDSISKSGYTSNFDLSEIKKLLKNRSDKIIALGGIDEDKVEIVKDIGFYGIAVLGALWQSTDPVQKFKRLKEKWEATQLINLY